MTAPNWQAIDGAAASQSGMTDCVPTNPTHLSGDLLIAMAEMNGGTAPTVSGWTQQLRLGGSGQEFDLWTLRADSASETDPTFPGHASRNHIHAVVANVRNVHQVYPIHALAHSLSISAETSVYAPGIKTTVDDCLYLGIVAYQADSAGPMVSAISNPDVASITERYDAGTDIGNGGGLVISSGSVAAPTQMQAVTSHTATGTAFVSVSAVFAPIADIQIDVEITIDGDMGAAIGVGEVRLLDITQPTATYLVVNQAIADAPEEPYSSDGQAAARFFVPYTDHEYIAVYTDTTGNIFGSSDVITYSGGFPTAVIDIDTGGGGPAETVDPVITAVSLPTASGDPLVISLYDASSALALYVLTCKDRSDGKRLTIYNPIDGAGNAGFVHPFAGKSTVTGSGTSGDPYIFTIYRRGRWPTGISIDVRAQVVDASGNEANA